MRLRRVRSLEIADHNPPTAQPRRAEGAISPSAASPTPETSPPVAADLGALGVLGALGGKNPKAAGPTISAATPSVLLRVLRASVVSTALATTRSPKMVQHSPAGKSASVAPPAGSRN